MLTVLAVSEPSNNGTLAGTPIDGYVFTPSTSVVADIDSNLNYLVTDPDGHVAQGVITIRILAADDLNQPPIARADVARTNAGSQAFVNVRGNDFDLDVGDTVSVVAVAVPAHGTEFFTASSIYYTPDAGFSGVETITYTIRDTHGLTATAVLRVGVDTEGNSSTRPDAETDYFYVYQGSSVGFSTAELLDNDPDSGNRMLTVLAVSEPSNNGTLAGTPIDGYVFTPSTSVVADIDSNLNYLVTDPDGHVAQGVITIRILAADDLNQPPIARADVVRTNAGSQVIVNVRGNDFDLDVGDTVSVVAVAVPAHGAEFFTASSIYYIPDAGFSGVETITYTIRDTHGLTATAVLRVGVDTEGNSSTRPDAQTDYFYVYQGSSVGFSTAELLDNDPDSGNRMLTVLAVSEPVQQRHPGRHSHRRVRLHPQHQRGRGHRQQSQLPRHRPRRPRRPGRHHHPHPRRRRPQPPTHRGSRFRTDERWVPGDRERARQRFRP